MDFLIFLFFGNQFLLLCSHVLYVDSTSQTDPLGFMGSGLSPTFFYPIHLLYPLHLCSGISFNLSLWSQATGPLIKLRPKNEWTVKVPRSFVSLHACPLLDTRFFFNLISPEYIFILRFQCLLFRQYVSTRKWLLNCCFSLLVL